MNPMKELKSEFDFFKTFLNDDFKETNLNKSAPRVVQLQMVPDYCLCNDPSDYKVIEKKGVQSDFIKIFKIKLDKNFQYSLAFVFDYISAETPTMNFSLKIKNTNKETTFLNSESIELDQMKEKMKLINKKLKNSITITNEDIISIVTVEFLDKKIEQLISLPVKMKMK